MNNGSMFHTNLFAAYQALLRDRLQYLLAGLHPLLYTDVVCALEAPGKLLALPRSENEIVGFWSLLTLLVALHVFPGIDFSVASSVAVGLECFLCAGDMFDDIEDGDLTPIVQHLGSARTVNVSSSLCFLSQKAIASLSMHGVAPDLIVSLLQTFVEASLHASGGQHQDLLAEQSSLDNFTREKCLEIVERKSGTLVKLACQLGAMCAGADDAMYQSFSILGNLLGIAEQLDNDIHDLYNLLYRVKSVYSSDTADIDKRILKTDLVRGKKTLPIVIAAQSEKSLQETFLLGTSINDERCQKAIYEGIIATRAISLLYRERARDCLQVIETHHPISLALRTLLKF